MGYALQGVGLKKSFVNPRSIREILLRPFGKARRTDALQGIDLAIPQGQIFGLLGPNGAGKTTLIKIFCCLILPDHGRALVDGVNTTDEDRVKLKIGLVHSDERSFYWRLSARENLRFFARLYDVPSRQIESRIEFLLDRVEMLDAADRAFSSYSSGMKQRVAIARALLHDPPILLMDEPTRSLDPQASRSLRRFVRDELNGKDGKTIVLATHDLREAEMLADRLAIIVKGKVLQEGTVPEVRGWGVREHRFRIVLDAEPRDLSGPFRTLSDATENGSRVVHVSVDDGVELDDVLRPLLSSGARLHACDRVESDLEEAFARILDAEGGVE